MSTEVIPDGTTARIPLPDKARVAAEVTAGIRQWCDLLLRIEDLNTPAVGTWTARDVAAHFASGLPLYAGLLEGKPSPISSSLDETGGVNEAGVRSVAETDRGALAEQILAGTDGLVAAVMARDGDPEVPWHMGVPLPLSCLLGLVIGEIAVHGYDLAQAHGSRWHIPPEWGHSAFLAAVPVLPLLLDPDAAAGVESTFDIRMRGTGAPRAVLRISGGRLTVHPPGTAGRVDCYLSGDPLTLLLVLYGRIGPIRPALTGRALAWGRKPWRGLTMTSLFRNP
jgi:uncharacterized protein (TIGR03083 family)